jgi:hypothetical protein
MCIDIAKPREPKARPRNTPLGDHLRAWGFYNEGIIEGKKYNRQQLKMGKKNWKKRKIAPEAQNSSSRNSRTILSKRYERVSRNGQRHDIARWGEKRVINPAHQLIYSPRRPRERNLSGMQNPKNQSAAWRWRSDAQGGTKEQRIGTSHRTAYSDVCRGQRRANELRYGRRHSSPR